MRQDNRQPTILTITGSDGTGGAGVQQDLKTAEALGVAALSAITTITMQNTLGIQAFFDLPPEVLERQLEAILDDVQPEAVKIGLLRNTKQVEVVCRIIRKYRLQHIVYGPIATATSGERLMSEELSSEIERKLAPLCDIVANRQKVKTLIDWDIHGMRGLFSTAIAAFLAKGCQQEEAIAEASSYINRQVAMESQLEGRGAEHYNELLTLIARDHQTHADVQHYASAMNVSPRYLAQVTKRMGGLSPKQLIDQHRTEAIKGALRQSNLTIQEIAYAYGFVSQSHFTKYFKKETGRTPTDFRQQSS